MWSPAEPLGEDQFDDRSDAGRQLGAELKRALESPADALPIVLALPRGGVPVGYEVAAVLDAPLDVYVVRKLGVPGHEELAVGAIASGGTRVVNREVGAAYGLEGAALDRIAERERHELERREESYRRGWPPLDVSGRTAILVDDGLATGSTMRAAVAAVRDRRAGSVVVAVPVAPSETCQALRSEADEVICLRTPEPFHAVGLWYVDFTPVDDEAVAAILDRARRRQQ